MDLTPSPEKSYTSPIWVGLDVGGTKIEGVAVDDSGVLRGRILQPTDTLTTERSVESIIQALHAVLDSTGANPGDIAGVGLGIPGKVSDGNVSLAVNLKLEIIPVGTGSL